MLISPPANPLEAYSADYFVARRRFREACERGGWQQQALPIDAPSPTDEPLSIDVAVLGAARPESAIVVSSGLHGVEGPFGSAVQLTVVESLAPDWRPPAGAALVMLHALNPFGFAWQRRFNEENIDLNRNFLLADQAYSGAPPLSGRFRSVMSPSGYHRRLRMWSARMALLALRHGVKSFWQTMPVGQYEFADWLFYGGKAPTQTARTLGLVLPDTLGDAREVVHLDFHTGLGRWAECQLLLGETESDDNRTWWSQRFRETHIKQTTSTGDSYPVRGGFGPWLGSHFPACQYRYAVAEFGTYSPRQVIKALAEELHWHLTLGGLARDHWSRQRLADAFVPPDRGWRSKALATGLSLVDRAAGALWP